MFKKLTIMILGLSATTLFAQTTMCFKQNHESLITIENTNLDGGECQSAKSANDMKKDGWTVSDIKISPSNNGNSNDFIYIFKKELNASIQNEEELMAKLQSKLKDEETKNEEIKKEEIFARNSKAGERFFLKNCAVCHGNKGELNARGVSRPIKDLDHNEFQLAIRDYITGNKDGITAMLMSQYANIMDSNDIRNVYTYLKFINQEKIEE